jgi:LacI family transcriptional regulator
MPSVPVTIADVARASGVSITTVSRVLSPGATPHPVNSDTAERVRAAARELSFVPSAIARGLVARRSGLIGLVVPDLTDPHYPQIASGVEHAARTAELAVLICNTLGDPLNLGDYLRLLRARQVDAIVLSGGSSLGVRELRLAAQCGVPVVLIGRPGHKSELPYVSIDNLRAAREATQHLVDTGRRHIVHLAGPVTQTTMFDRTQGYLDAVKANDIWSGVVETAGSPEQAYDLLLPVLKAKRQPDAVFASTDRLAIAAMAAIYDSGLKVPEDIAVMGFDDIPLAAQLRPSLSSVTQPADQLGAAAVELALAFAAGRPTPPVILPARPVVRGSTRKRAQG